MAVRRSPGSGPKEGATSPQARAAAYGDKLSQLEKDMAEMRDGTIKDVLEKLRLLSFEIEEINRRFGTVDHTGNTIDDLRVRLDYYSNEMADLRRQVERGSTPLPSQNQQAGTFPIPMYSGERNSLPRFLKLFYSWALSHRSEDALSYSRPVIMTSKKSQSDFEGEYGRRDVKRSLVVWSALMKAVENKTIADIVVGAKAPSVAWKILNSIVVVFVSHIQRIGCQPEKTTLHGGQSRSWSAEQGKENKRKSLAAYPPPPPTPLVRRK